MTQAVTGPTDGHAAEPSLVSKHHFLLRRLHSLTGITPVGTFLCFHLFTNAQMVFGGFQHEVEWIHSLPALLILEVFGIWLPIAFHTVLGIVYIFTGERNTRAYPYADNWRYTLQRWTAWISLFFIFYHVATLRWGWTIPNFVDYPFLAVGLDNYELALPTTAMALQGGPLGGALNVTLYLVGALAVVYHFANGLWTAAITWGLTLTVDAQKKWGYVCLAVGLALAAFTLAAVYGAFTYDITDADRAAVEAAIQYISEHGKIPH